MEQGDQAFSFCGSESISFKKHFPCAVVAKPVCYYKPLLTDLHLQLGTTLGNSASTEDTKQDLAFAKNQLGKVWGAKSYLLLPLLASLE